jgi:hypothetical protein
MLKTVLADGSAFVFDLGDRSGFTSHRFELGMFAGEWGNATYIATYGSFSLNSQLAIEAQLGQFLGKFTNGNTVDVGLTHVFFPEWRLSPFVDLGTGFLFLQPKATLVQPTDRTTETAYVGGGLRFYLTRRFFLRAEFRSHYIFTNLNQNQRADEWKGGFAFFF